MKTKSFGGVPEEFSSYEKAKVILQSITYDGTSTWGKGADLGFNAFIDASENMELYDIETDSEVYKQGIHSTEELNNFLSAGNMFQQSYARAQELLKSDKFLTFFGGEHSISIGIIKAFYEKYEDLTVLQIDAHADLRPEYGGTPYNHASAMYDASKNCNLVQVGIRSMDSSERDHMDLTKVFWGEDIRNGKPWIEHSIALCTDNVYISFDLDAFDPSIMPATGTPEPGGLYWNETLAYLRRVFKERNVVGFDLVELAPIEGLKSPQFLAAKLYYKMLSYKFLNQ